VNHVALLVGDVEASRRFYGGVLGMEEVPRPASFDFPGAWFRRGNLEMHLIGEAEPGRARQTRPGYSQEELADGYCVHLGLEVENMDEAYRQIEERGVEVVGGPRDRGDGVLQLYLADPDGYVVELMARAGSGAADVPVRSGSLGRTGRRTSGPAVARQGSGKER
jgi:catechol 2,3-dioxygenase-like lactoylglutathione lyase family enzyme